MKSCLKCLIQALEFKGKKRMIELLFLMGFTLHNIEEGIWLPAWSRHAGKYHKEVSGNEFRFAVIAVTALGYLFTFQYFIFPHSFFSRHLYLAFILMMTINVIFPHLAATLILKRYAPGLLTGVMLNAPIGIYILSQKISSAGELLYTILFTVILAVIFIILIKILFKIENSVFK